MENKMNKFGFEKLLAVLVGAFACVCIWGCSEDKVRWHEGFTGARIVGFVNDSLVMVGSLQQRTESHEGTFEPYWDVIEAGHERLCVYNYRVQENGPRWCDTLGEYNTTNAFRGQMTDSIVWGGDMPNSIRLWKVGETQHLINLIKITEGCSVEFGIGSVKQWLNGTFIARSDESLNAAGDSCQYAVLDTMARTLTFKRLEKSLEWIKECDDVRAWGDDVFCSEPGKQPLEGHILKNNTDTLSAPLIFSRGIFWGKMIELRASICQLEKESISCLDADYTWSEPLKFYQKNKVVVDLE